MLFAKFRVDTSQNTQSGKTPWPGENPMHWECLFTDQLSTKTEENSTIRRMLPQNHHLNVMIFQLPPKRTLQFQLPGNEHHEIAQGLSTTPVQSQQTVLPRSPENVRNFRTNDTYCPQFYPCRMSNFWKRKSKKYGFQKYFALPWPFCPVAFCCVFTHATLSQNTHLSKRTVVCCFCCVTKRRIIFAGVCADSCDSRKWTSCKKVSLTSLCWLTQSLKARTYPEHNNVCFGLSW